MALSPGFAAPGVTLARLADHLASHGFVVFTIDTLSPLDLPAARGDQLLAALRHLTRGGPFRHRVDPGRLAVAGHSVGGGAALEAARKQPGLRAAVPMAPWHLHTDWSGVRVPTLVVAGEKDTVASPAAHAERFYATLTAAPEKAYLELRGSGHDFELAPEPTVRAYTVVWLKRFLDGDTRYDTHLCPPPALPAISEYRDTCPHGG
ncbi:hypothetical protein GCM10027168_36120 [Streptomyces capparidis]